MIPEYLKQFNHWVCWQYETRANGKKTKVPKCPYTGSNAASDNPATWASYEEAVKAREAHKFDGIGFMLKSDEVPIVGIDLDHCINGSGLESWAKEIVTKVNSYSEITPSGKGLRIFALGDLPPTGRKKGNVEMYKDGRFLTVTGNALEGTLPTIEDRADEIKAIHQDIFGATRNTSTKEIVTRPNNVDDKKLLEIMFNAANGSDIEQLYRHGNFPAEWSHSEADLSLCNHLAFYTGNDSQRIDSLFRQSALMRDKWDRPTGDSTYGRLTIGRAVSGTQNVFSGNGKIEVTETSQETTPNLLQLFPHYKLTDGLNLPDPEYHIYGAIAQGDIGMTYGESTAGKTYISVDMAVCLSAGLPWMGNWSIERPQKVLYFISEGRKKFFRRILAAINGMSERQLDTAKIFNLVNENLTIVPEVPQLFLSDAKRYVKRYVEAWEYIGKPHVDYLFIDTLHRASVGSDENSSKDAGIVVDAITWLQKKLNRCTANFVHHSNKSGGYRGSTAYKGNVDFVFRVEGVLRAPRILTIEKIRDGEPDGPMEGLPYVAKFKVDEQSQGTYVTWLSEDEAQDILEDKSKGIQPRDKAKKEIKRILDNGEILSQNRLAKKVKSASHNTAIEAIKELADNGEINYRSEGNSILYYASTQEVEEF